MKPTKPTEKRSLPMWKDDFSSPFLPTTAEEIKARKWDQPDIIFVTGDAYIDHPSFAMALLGRVLEKAGFRVAILSQPDWRSCEPWRKLGKPRLFYAISAGNMDSMINHYTANKKVRNDDAYSPGGKIGLRPDRATLAYCQRAREAFPGVPVIAGGVEASLRRLAHYDYWSDTVKRSILLDAKADLVVYGMGEARIVEIAQRLQRGESLADLRDMRGIAYVLGAKESAALRFAGEQGRSGSDSVPQNQSTAVAGHALVRSGGTGNREQPEIDQNKAPDQAAREVAPRASEAYQREPSPPSNLLGQAWYGTPARLPSFEEVAASKEAFAEATRIIHTNTNPFNAKTLVQFHEQRAVVQNPPSLPLTEAEMDAIYDLPYTRRPHPSYAEPIPAHEMIKDSVTIMRGCFGGCTFCSITAHQGRIIQSRSKGSVLRELSKMSKDPEFKGVVSDVGGPTANMYKMRCTKPEVEAVCKRQSCVHPTICKLLGTSHEPLIELLQDARETKGIRKVFVASGVRMDLAQRSDEYLKEMAEHHIGGHLKVAPEHTDPKVLELMKKPVIDDFGGFAKKFKDASEEVGKPKQYLVPYFIASHPGSDLDSMIHLALYLKQNGYRPDQVQDFIPGPFDVATCMYYTGIEPFSKKEVHVAKNLNDRKMQRALMQFFKPENYFWVREALLKAGRKDLIGGCDGLIPANPPREALEARRESANESLRESNSQKSSGYRPGRRTARRQDKA